MSIGPYPGQTGKFAGQQVKSMPKFTPEQMAIYNKYVGMQGPGQQQMMRIAEGSPEAFEQLEAPAMRQFSQLMGGLGSRFTGGPSGQFAEVSGRRSSGFGLAGSSAAQQMAEQLQSTRLGLQSQATRDLFDMSNKLLGMEPYDQYMMPKKKKWWEQALGIGLPIAGTAVGAAFGMPQLGGAVGSLAGQAFSGGY